MESGKLREIIGQWLEKANHDLMIVERDLAHDAPVTDVACFHCQQAVEKYLKAFLVSHLVKQPRIHDIEALIRECAAFDGSFAKIQNISYLTDYAVELRYPDDFYMPSLDDAHKAFEDAKMVKDFVSVRLNVS